MAATFLSKILALQNPPFLVGGFLRTQYDGKGYSDIDWFCLNVVHYQALQRVFESLGLIQIATHLSDHYAYYVTPEDFASGCRKNVHQLFYNPQTPSLNAFLLEHRDFTVSKIAYDGVNYFTHPRFSEDVLSLRLRYNTAVGDVVSPQRVVKFLNRGYCFEV